LGKKNKTEEDGEEGDIKTGEKEEVGEVEETEAYTNASNKTIRMAQFVIKNLI